MVHNSLSGEDSPDISEQGDAEERLRQHLRARLGEEEADEIVAEMTGERQRSEDTDDLSDRDDVDRDEGSDGP